MTRKQMPEYHKQSVCLVRLAQMESGSNSKLNGNPVPSSSVNCSWCLREKWSLQKHLSPKADTIPPSISMGQDLMRGKAA